MTCTTCGYVSVEGGRFCGKCGASCEASDDAESAPTAAWPAAAAPVRFSTLDEDDEPLELPRNRRLPLLVGGALVLTVGLVVAFAALGGAQQKDVTVQAPTASTAAQADEGRDEEETRQAAAEEPSEGWWSPPPGHRKDVIVPGYAFSDVGVDSPGALYDAKLRPIRGADNLFEPHEPRRLQRNEMKHSFTRLSSTLEIGLGLAEVANVKYRSDRFYAVYRALDVQEVIAVDERKRMREPPKTATYYLAEIHVGWAYDMVIEGASRDMGAKLDKALLNGASLGGGVGSESYRVTHKALGLKPRGTGAIFATTAEEVAAAYSPEGAAVPVRLVFRQIPGRKIKGDEVAWPEPVIEETVTLDEGVAMPVMTKSYRLEPGKYTISITTHPNGVGVAWSSSGCTTGVVRQLTTFCTFKATTDLTVSNPRVVGIGDAEVVEVYITRGRDPSAVEAFAAGN